MGEIHFWYILIGAVKTFLTFVPPSRKTFLEVVRQFLLPLFGHPPREHYLAHELLPGFLLGIDGIQFVRCDELCERCDGELQSRLHFY